MNQVYCCGMMFANILCYAEFSPCELTVVFVVALPVFIFLFHQISTHSFIQSVPIVTLSIWTQFFLVFSTSYFILSVIISLRMCRIVWQKHGNMSNGMTYINCKMFTEAITTMPMGRDALDVRIKVQDRRKKKSALCKVTTDKNRF